MRYSPDIAKSFVLRACVGLSVWSLGSIATLAEAQQASPETGRHAFLLQPFLLAILVIMILGAIPAIWLLRRRAQRSTVEALDDDPTHTEFAAVLYDINDPSDIKRYDLGDKSTVIGRLAGYDPEVQYVLVAEPTVGRCHALIERRGQSYWVMDQGSVNGTYLNGRRISGEHALKHGDILRVHRHEFEFVLPDQYDSQATVMDMDADALAASQAQTDGHAAE